VLRPLIFVIAVGDVEVIAANARNKIDVAIRLIVKAGRTWEPYNSKSMLAPNR
jgi:hypothetical protein